MSLRSLLRLLLSLAVALASVEVAGCELAVQIDRGLVEGGEDDACPICTDAEDEGSDAEDTEGSPEGGRTDAAASQPDARGSSPEH